MSENKTKRSRTQRNFPAAPFEDALDFAREIFRIGAGQPVRRLTLFDELGKSPDSGPSRQLITNSNKYGLTTGSYTSEQLALTEIGLKCVDDGVYLRERIRNKVNLGILQIEPFAGLYKKFEGSKLPASAVLTDSIKEFDVKDDAAKEAVDTFIVNLRYLNLLQVLAGADRIVSLDHVLDSVSEDSPLPKTIQTGSRSNSLVTDVTAKFETTAFYIAPIGEEHSEQRKHSDLFLGTIVEPALEGFNLQVVRADAIESPGLISKQVIEYILKARLVIADLSFHNPNVFYELALRHMINKPVVQVMRSSDNIPFDVSHVRTIRIDTTDIYSFAPKIEGYRSEVASQVRIAMENPDAVDNPVVQYFPELSRK